MKQHLSMILVTVALLMAALPAHAQYPESLKKQMEYLAEKQRQAAEQLKKQREAREQAKEEQQEKQEQSAPKPNVPPVKATPPVSQPPKVEPITGKDPRSAKDPRVSIDTRGTDGITPSSYPRSASPSSAYPALQQTEEAPAVKSIREATEADDKDTVEVCAIDGPQSCSQSLAEANRACSSKAESCKMTPSSKRDQSCSVISCDIDKAECMQDALGDYVKCMKAALDSDGQRE